MAESVISRTLSGGVGRRIFLFFLIAAVVPTVFTAALAYHEFGRSIENEVARNLRASAKEYGVEILSRLETASEMSAEIARIVEQEGTSALASRPYLLRDFEAVWIVGENGPPSLSIGEVSPNVMSIAEKTDFGSRKGTALVQAEGGELLMLRPFAKMPATTLALQLTGSKIWGARDNLPSNTEFCIFTESGRLLHCTSEFDTGLHASILLEADDSRASIFTEWQPESGNAQFASLWQLFLAGAFDSPALDIIAIQPKDVAMRAGADFRRIFIPATALIFILVGVLSLNLIGRSLVPLRNITLAARQVAGGNLGSRVRVRTGDEFEWLAEAFNNMAARIGGQIAALEAMSGIDRMILTGTKIEEISEDVVAHLLRLTDCEAAAVIARDADAPEVALMTTRWGDEIERDRVQIPDDAGHQWCQPRQVSLCEIDPSIAPYAEKFRSFHQTYAILIPVVMHDELKGVLLLGFPKKSKLSHNGLQRCIDLAGRFAVALSSAEREETLYRQAHFDQLTGLPNRQLLKDRLAQCLASARIEHHSGAILFLDLDRFKEINDVFGHSVGDALLQQAAKRIGSEVRERDTVARLGGDEFVVVLPHIRNDSVVRASAERLLDTLSEAFTIDSVDHYVSASIGIAMFPDDGATVETLLKNADAAMYRAKESGRGRAEFFSRRLNSESRRKITMERDLRNAFQEGELQIFFQPQFDITTGNISGAEALLRWEHEGKGFISPEEFVPLAEDSGLIVEIGSWVIEEACSQLSSILEKGLHPGPVSINVSTRQLADSDFKRTVMEPIRRFGIHPGFVQLEVTETTVAENRDQAKDILQSLRDEGVRVAIDDFGTGYSSLSYLEQMPFDVIKIDKSFIDRIGSSVTSDNICKTIIKMAEQLGKKSIAEGAEEQYQIDFLRRNGCDFVQGFYYARALEKDEFLAFIEKQDFHTQRRKALEVL